MTTHPQRHMQLASDWFPIIHPFIWLLLGFFVLCFVVAKLGQRLVQRLVTKRQMRKLLGGNVVRFDNPWLARRRKVQYFYRRIVYKPNPLWLVLPAVFLALYFTSFNQSPDPTRLLKGRVTHVRDGDTIVVTGTPIRFAELDCAELGTAAGERAKQRMLRLVSGKRVSCRLSGRKSYDRMIGECSLENGKSLSSVMIREGYCSRWR